MKAGGFGSNDLARRLGSALPFGRVLVRALYPPMPTLNIIPNAQLDLIKRHIFVKGGLVVNVGAGGQEGSGRRLWQNIDGFGAHVLAVDIGPGSVIDVVADAGRLPFATQAVDSIVLQAVLEHVREPEAVLAEAYRALRPGGHLYIEMPFLQGFHADPHDYQRFTLEGLRVRLAAFEEVLSGVSVGPFSTLVWIARDGLSAWARNPIVYALCRFVAGWVFSPFRYLDVLVGDGRVGRRLANEYYFLARKPDVT
jgi:SAM-dependent methyltransferase